PQTYGGVWLGKGIVISPRSNVTVESYPDATVVGQVTNFQTTDPRVSCLNGQAINVFSAPNELPGVYVVHDGLQGPMCAYGTWTIPITYGSTWQGQPTNLSAQTYASVAGYPDAALVGQVSYFQTNDPALSCLNGATLNVYNAPAEYPNQYVVNNG